MRGAIMQEAGRLIQTETTAEPRSTAEGDVVLRVPEDDVAEPELSLVVPALDEELTIGEFVDWCKQGLAAAGAAGEILIVDSSTDRTAEIALSKGARVLKTPRRGLGRAYIDALSFVRGRWIVMGDADCTYDFRELAPFVEKFQQGYEFVMGSRFRGSIEPGSMPALHRYLGTPVTTWILNRLYSSKFSDIHCGMRGITRDALERMQIRSQSWEYASEMVLKSVHMKLATTEVPVRFLKDKEGRLSHHKRIGWWEPWRAAWINLRAMFVYGTDFFVLKPGLVMLGLGLLLTLPLTFGSLTIGPVTFSLYWMLAGLMLAVLGAQNFLLGVLAQVFYDQTGDARRRWLALFRYDRAVVVSALLFAAGVGLFIPLVVKYFGSGLSLPPSISAINHFAVTGILLIILSFTLFTFTLMIHAASLLHAERNGPGV
jgi:glycosyltransferase involved in cell wall biosynthesis